MSEKIPDKWLYVPLILLGVYFFIRIIDQSKLIYSFPFDFANDISAYMASLFFLAQCGFNKFCPYWYNGFISFHTFFPGWQFFTYPIYMLSKNVLFSTYVSIIFMYALSFFFIFLLGRNENFSITKMVAFFLFFFTNAINVGDFFKLGRVVSLFGFCMFLGITVFVFYYRKRKIDKRFLLLIPVYSFAILSHPQEAVLSSILIILLFLVKSFYEKLIIIFSVILSFVLTSFWWVPFILNLSKGSVLQHDTNQGVWLWATSGPFLWDSVAAFFVSIIFFIVFYYYWLSKNKSKKELLFFSPIVILNVLFFFRITPLIPILNNISPDPYMVFFIFFIIYFFLSINPAVLKGSVKTVMPYALVGIVLISVGISHFKTPYFVEHDQVNKDTLEILGHVDDKYLFMNGYKDSYARAYYSYASVYLSLSTASGWYPYIATPEYNQRLKGVGDPLIKGDCETFIEEAQFFNVTNFVAYEGKCKELESCNLKKVKEKGVVCLYKLNLILDAS